MSADGASAIQSVSYEDTAIRQLIKESQRKMDAAMAEQVSISEDTKIEVLRRQIEALGFYSDRTMATEMTNRDLSSLFNSFSLVNRIMQSMG